MKVGVLWGVKSPPATIVTAYDPTTLSAFASIATDLLIKPFDAERFQTALDMAKASIIRSRAEFRTADDLSSDQFRTVRRQFNRHGITSDCMSGTPPTHLIRQSIQRLQALLDPNRFLRVHRNVIVNLDHVEEFHLLPKGNMFVKMNNGVNLPLRRGNRAMLRKQLKDIS